MCIFHRWELVGIFYEEFYEEFSSRHDNYGIKILEVYRCDKCNKQKIKVVDFSKDIYGVVHKKRIDSLREKGVKDIFEYKLENIKRRNKNEIK